MARRKYASAVSGSNASACLAVLLDLLELLGIQRFTLPEDAGQERMGRPGNLRRAHRADCSGWSRPRRNGGCPRECRPGEAGLRGPTCWLWRMGLDRLQGGFAVALGILLAGLGQDAPVPGSLPPPPVGAGPDSTWRRTTHRRTGDRPPSPERPGPGRGVGGGTCAGDTPCWGLGPGPAHVPDAGGCPRPSRWRSRTAGRGPSPGTSSRSSPDRPEPLLRSRSGRASCGAWRCRSASRRGC